MSRTPERDSERTTVPAPRWGWELTWATMTVALLGAGFLKLCLIQIIDDAYITFRCAQNWATGFGPVYNPGQAVESSTSLMWTALIAGLFRLGVDPATVIAYIGAGFAGLSLVAAYALARRCGATWQSSAVALAVVAGVPQFWLAAANGLGGGLYSLILVATTGAVLYGRSSLVAGALGGLLFAARPEGAAVLPLVLGVRWMWERGTPLTSPFVWRSGVMWAIVILIVECWRLYCFGALIPNSLLAKMNPVTPATLAMGWAYLGSVAGQFPHLLGAIVFALLLHPRKRIVAFVALLAVFQGSLLLKNGGDWMEHFRLPMMVAPLILPLLGLSLNRALMHDLISVLGLSAITAMIVIGIFCAAADVEPDPRREFHAHQPSGGYAVLARELRPVLQPSDIVVLEALGRGGFELQEFEIHDFLGLTDPWIARHGDRPMPRFGKSAFTHTIGETAPTIIVCHAGLSHIRVMHQATPEFAKEYTVFKLKAVGMVVCIRNSAVLRLQAALITCKPEVVPVADFQ